MNNIDWLNGLTKAFSGNTKAYLDALEINLENFYKIKISGNSFRVTTISTLIEALPKIKISAICIGFNFIGSINEMIKKGIKAIDDESLDFHISCIKTLNEELKLDISFYEALYLIAINYAREQKVNYFIVEEAYDFINVINYDYEISTISKENTISIDNINPKDYYEYKSELCSFSYNNIDYDMPFYGSFNGLYTALAIYALEEILPDKKAKKYKSALINMPNKGISERVNHNPRIILNVMDYNDISFYKECIKKTLDREIVVISIDKNYNPDILILDLADATKAIINSKTDTIILFVGNREFVESVRSLFFTKK